MIKPNFTAMDIKADMKRRVFQIQRAMIKSLQLLGEECVNYARTHREFQDQSGNLINSIGYLVMANREVVGANFDSNVVIKRVSKKNKNYGIDPHETARRLAMGIGLQYPADSMVLVVVAGMDYAFHVETMDRDVITGSSLHAKKRFPELLKGIEKIIGKTR